MEELAMKWTGLGLWCAAALVVACSAEAPKESVVDGDRTATSGAIDNDDRDFVREMMETGVAEVQLGRLASARGTSAEVRQFGETMVADHTSAGKQLEAIAMQYGIHEQHPTLDDNHGKLLARLSALKGAEFDREYIDAMVNGHEGVVDKLQSRVDERDRLATATGQAPKDVNVRPESGDNAFEASLNQWAAQTLPVAKGHLERAKGIEDGLERRVSSR
jgi:putative membrane protein